MPGRDRAGHVQRQAVRAELRVHRLRPLVQQRSCSRRTAGRRRRPGPSSPRCATRSRRPASPRSAYAGANASYYMVPRDPDQRREDRRTEQVLKDIDNLEAGRLDSRRRQAGRRRRGPRSAPSTPTRRSSASSTPRSSCSRTRTRWPSTRAAPGWRTSRPRTPRPASSTRSCRCPSVTTSDKLPPTAIYAAAGEMYFAAAKGKNPQGGKEYLRAHAVQGGARWASPSSPSADRGGRARPTA